ncbi:MAG TPA: DUF4178 domain-containing protein [Spirochaetota bacterium]|nr:DUF4178 domain-containing protein [Spirochaetota bacterium]HPF04473.1 DUF4178 domain-containing protein [Spirochaetota bacterium]HPJ40755.1 DUF4178 domain-containing protein [Spirochaetota bacterium]HPR36024.1 DUF4178 domain-containing protein [Spirochaetota bacterium]HRX45938.1 DUF4178 domain-containing protein [Spirochaetota bacterium]
MGDNREELQALKCPSCSGDLVKSSRTYYDDDEEENVTVPLARCVQCNTEYDQHTKEYYEVFADELTADKDSTVFKLGLKGNLKGVQYEIIGRLRYQDEEEYEKSTWDEWVAVTDEGSYHYFVEEDGEIYSYSEYTPDSIDMESSSSYIEFDGRNVNKSDGYNARIVLAEGELPWQPEIGEAVLCYDFKNGGKHYTIEQSEDEVSITQGERIKHGEIIEAFNIESYKEIYQNTVKKRSEFQWKSRIYLTGMCLSFAATIFSCFSSTPVKGVMNTKQILTSNETVQDTEGRIYSSQILYGPFEISQGNSLYDVGFSVDESVQNFNLEWQSIRMMLVSEKRLQETVKDGINNPSVLKDLFEEIDAMPEPVESFIITGDFWDEEGRDSDGYWHESDLSFSNDFVLDEAGKYYVYLELYNNKMRRADSVIVEISRVKGYRYYIFAFIIFFILWGVSQIRSKSYNELPFEMSGV